MDAYQKKFKEAKRELPLRDMTIRYNIYRVNPKWEYLCVVEGPSDWNFYKNVNISALQAKRCAYIWHKGENAPIPDSDQFYQSKEAVIRTYKEICSNYSLSKELCRTFFIVDRDYQDVLICQKTELTDDDRKNITVTKYHSLESYFLTDYNIEELIRYLEIPLEEIENIVALLTELRDKSVEYFSLIGACAACYKNNGWKKPNYKKQKNIKDIFSFSFDNSSFSFLNEYMNVEIDTLRNALKHHKEANLEYKKIKNNIKENYLFLQGHTLFDFLSELLIQKYSKHFGYVKGNSEMINSYLDFINQMNIELNIVFGNGKRLI